MDIGNALLRAERFPDWPQGTFWQPGKTEEDGTIVYPDYAQEATAKPPATVPNVSDCFCKAPEVSATATFSKNRIIFCPFAFANGNLPAKPEGRVDTVEFERIGIFDSGSRDFVHELVHLWTGCKFLQVINQNKGKADLIQRSYRPNCRRLDEANTTTK